MYLLFTHLKHNVDLLWIHYGAFYCLSENGHIQVYLNKVEYSWKLNSFQQLKKRKAYILQLFSLCAGKCISTSYFWWFNDHGSERNKVQVKFLKTFECYIRSTEILIQKYLCPDCVNLNQSLSIASLSSLFLFLFCNLILF